jgi:hypothetical protein
MWGTGQLPGHGFAPKCVVIRYTNGALGSAAIAGSQSSTSGSATRSPAQPGAGAAAAAATFVRTCHLMPCSFASVSASSRSSVASDNSSSTSEPPPRGSPSPPDPPGRGVVTTNQMSRSTTATAAESTAIRRARADIVPPQIRSWLFPITTQVSAACGEPSALGFPGTGLVHVGSVEHTSASRYRPAMSSRDHHGWRIRRNRGRGADRRRGHRPVALRHQNPVRASRGGRLGDPVYEAPDDGP